jgi:hypothetical protein
MEAIVLNIYLFACGFLAELTGTLITAREAMEKLLNY